VANDQISELLAEIRRDTLDDARKADSWAERNHWSHIVFGIAAVIAGTVAGVSGAASWPAWLTAIAGFGAALLAGLQTFLKAEEKAQFHWRRAADLKAIARDAGIMAAESETTTADVRELSRRYEDVQGRQFGPSERPASGPPPS
jgi:hypothetical protein